MAPVLAVYAGLSLDDEKGDIITGPDLAPYVEGAMNELEVRPLVNVISQVVYVGIYS